MKCETLFSVCQKNFLLLSVWFYCITSIPKEFEYFVKYNIRMQWLVKVFNPGFIHKIENVSNLNTEKIYSVSLGCVFCFMMHKMFSVAGRAGLQADLFSDWTLLLWSHAVVIHAVYDLAMCCWYMRDLFWKSCHLDGRICFFEAST